MRDNTIEADIRAALNREQKDYIEHSLRNDLQALISSFELRDICDKNETEAAFRLAAHDIMATLRRLTI